MIYDVLGLVGVLLQLIGYALTVSGRIDAQAPSALLLNLAGAGLILLSLWHDFNLPAAVMEVAWVLVALAGMIQWLRQRRA